MRQFKVRFNGGKQSVTFHVGDTEILTQLDAAAYYDEHKKRRKRRGAFAHIYLPSMRSLKRAEFHELLGHEVTHFIDDWWRCRKGNEMTDNNEERRATLHGEIVRKFWENWSGR
jgi:hypothetical protein